ncbi:hypothetical protein FOA52_010867 [Chlamydomonas sp. UWO 241]|nr:hypothetical protein FOA52_010867 [Chlamydomonas sp. UWO 241]
MIEAERSHGERGKSSGGLPYVRGAAGGALSPTKANSLGSSPKGKSKHMTMLHDLQEYIAGVESIAKRQERELLLVKEEKREIQQVMYRIEAHGDKGAYVGFTESSLTDMPPRLRAVFEENKVLKETVKMNKKRNQALEEDLGKRGRQVLVMEDATTVLKAQLKECSRTPAEAEREGALKDQVQALVGRLKDLEREAAVLRKKGEVDAKLLRVEVREARSERDVLHRQCVVLSAALEERDNALRASALEVRRLSKARAPSRAAFLAAFDPTLPAGRGPAAPRTHAPEEELVDDGAGVSGGEPEPRSEPEPEPEEQQRLQLVVVVGCGCASASASTPPNAPDPEPATVEGEPDAPGALDPAQPEEEEAPPAASVDPEQPGEAAAPAPADDAGPSRGAEGVEEAGEAEAEAEAAAPAPVPVPAEAVEPVRPSPGGLGGSSALPGGRPSPRAKKAAQTHASKPKPVPYSRTQARSESRTDRKAVPATGSKSSGSGVGKAAATGAPAAGAEGVALAADAPEEPAAVEEPVDADEPAAGAPATGVEVEVQPLVEVQPVVEPAVEVQPAVEVEPPVAAAEVEEAAAEGGSPGDAGAEGGAPEAAAAEGCAAADKEAINEAPAADEAAATGAEEAPGAAEVGEAAAEADEAAPAGEADK